MQNKINITLEINGVAHSVQGLSDGSSAVELIDAFKRLLIGATFSPSILDDGYGHYEYIENGKENKK